MAEREYGLRAPDSDEEILRGFEGYWEAALVADAYPGDVVVVSEDAGRTWRPADTEEADRG